MESSATNEISVGCEMMACGHCKINPLTLAERYHIEDISPIPEGTDIIVKNLFCPVDKRGFLHAKDYLNGAELR